MISQLNDRDSMSTEEPPDVNSILRSWGEEHASNNYDPVPMLTRLAEIIEKETEEYLKLNPDPFDERHPSRAYPSCNFGTVLKTLFRKESFMVKLVNDYLRDTYYSRLGMSGDVRKLNIAACRLMLDIIPGLDIPVVFELPANNALVQRLFSWAEKSAEPLRTYATGLLAAAMEVQDIATRFRDQNARLVPLMLSRLHELKDSVPEVTSCRPFAAFATCSNENTDLINRKACSPVNISDDTVHLNGMTKQHDDEHKDESSRLSSKRRRHCSNENSCGPLLAGSRTNTNDSWSNSSWSERDYISSVGIQMHPLTLSTQQLFILRYLTPMGEYQEFLSHIFEKNALQLILRFINVRATKNDKLSFEALKYLAALLCHKKFTSDVISLNGLQRLLEVPRPSKASTGVSICLYYLAYCEDSMERVCLLPHHIMSELVKYALGLFECAHDSGRCHATMFFGLCFQFRVILEEFDAQDGLRKLFNVISTLPILRTEEVEVSEDEECNSRQIVRHVCVTLKKYMEAHLYIKGEKVRRAEFRDYNYPNATQASLPSYKAVKSTPESVRDNIKLLLEHMSFKAQWTPVEYFNLLGGINLLLKIIALSYEWNYSGRGETVRSALDVIGICSVVPKVQIQLCEKVDLPDENNMVGFSVILGAAEGDVVADAEVQRSALHIIITSVCAPINRFSGIIARYSITGSSSSKKKTVKSNDEVIEKVWDCLRTTNGIMVLLNLMATKMPITDADSIRALACQALCGLARSEQVRQIISKLPLFTTGQLQTLMKDPILQDRRQEHATFQKYAWELLEMVSGKSKPPMGSSNDHSLVNIHKANIIAQTRIQFNDRQLLELIHSHLEQHGLSQAAKALQHEANLPPPRPPVLPVPFTYVLSSPSNRIRPVKVSSENCSNFSSSHNHVPVTKITPIKLSLSSACIKGRDEPIKGISPLTPVSGKGGRSLEKQDAGGSRVADETSTSSRLQVTLDSIITEYLTNQHALCKNPMTTCPPFNLFQPHKCPDPKKALQTPSNFAVRYSRGLVSRRYNQRLIHSRFSCAHTFRYGEDNAYFTCCDFLKNDKLIAIGTQHGEVKVFGLNGNEVTAQTCHESYISHIECNKYTNLILTNSTWRTPLSACWTLKDNGLEMVVSLDEDDYAEFSKLSSDKIIGTKGETATIYDIESSRVIQRLTPKVSNQYTKNRGTFSPTDELVLCDGVLWDVSSATEIHKFDKLNQNLSGVFHPNGVELVSNTEVWDLRTFHLLRTVPTLDSCEVKFSPTSDIIYSVSLEKENEDDPCFETSFKTLDAVDYASIATIDVKKNIYDLACNGRGTHIALVENQGVFESVQESVVKIYDIGRPRYSEDDVPPNEEEEEDLEEASEENSEDDAHNDDSLGLDLIDDGDEISSLNDNSSSSSTLNSLFHSSDDLSSSDDDS